MFLHLSGKHGRIPKGALQRVNLLEKSSGASGRFPKNGFHDIVTLDPKKFVEMKQRCLHIGNRQRFRPRIWFKNSTSVTAPPLIYDPIRTQSNRSYRSYPPDIKAFLYYYMSPEKPRISGELRLRVTSSEDPASFESGSDLLLTNGRTWMRPLYGLNRSKHYIPLYAKLREEQFVSDELDAALSTLPSKSIRYRRSQHLYTLNDTFILDFSSQSHLFVITEQGVEKLPFTDVFLDSRASGKATPYTGRVLARFERSTLPDHKGTRTVLLRFLKIITPVKCVVPSYDGYLCCPKEGELFRRILTKNLVHKEKIHQVWSVNIDKPKYIKRGLQLLWDT